MFNVTEYLNQVGKNLKDHKNEFDMAQDHVKLTQLICEDAWLARQGHFGFAGAMERQLEYIGGTLLPNTLTRITRLASNGTVRGESYVLDSWFGTTNSETENIHNDDPDEQLHNAENFRDQLETRMVTAAILMVCHIKAHDELSQILDQLTYAQIKAKANMNRLSNARSA